MPASAIDAPITFRKPRRETESTHSEAPLGNSRCSASWKAGLPASSSRLRQYSGPALARLIDLRAQRVEIQFALFAGAKILSFSDFALLVHSFAPSGLLPG